jgi:hypothetical protein
VNAIAPGDEIIALDGVGMQRWLERAERHVSAETPYMAHSLMEYDFAIYVWIELGDVASFAVTVRKPGGESVSLKLPACTLAQMKASAAAQSAALSLDEPMREVKILSGGVGYLRPGPFYNAEAKTGAEAWDVSGFRLFIDNAFHDFRAHGVDRLIVDLRGNPGGDNLFSDVMIAWFADKPFRFFSQFKVRVSPQSTKANADRIANDAAAGPVSRQYAAMYAKARPGDAVDFELSLAEPRGEERFAGKVFVLIDRQSYSNAVSVAALVQDYKFGTILGEETSDMATTYGAMEQFTLPLTGVVVGYPKALIDSNPCNLCEPQALSRRHADGTVEAQTLAVEIGVAGQLQHEAAEFFRLAKALGERHRRCEAVEYVLRRAEHQRRREDPRHDRVDANAEIHQIARHGQDETVHAGLRRAVDHLADLRVLGSHGSRKHDQSAFAVFQRRRTRHAKR